MLVKVDIVVVLKRISFEGRGSNPTQPCFLLLTSYSAFNNAMQLHYVLVKVDSVVVSTRLVILKRISIESEVRILLNLGSLMQ